MRKLVLGCIALLSITGAAHAQNWTGGYFGLNLGGGTSKTDVDFTGFNFSTDTSSSNVVGGLQGGFDWQVGAAVLGIEGDIDGTSMEATASCPGRFFTCTTKIEVLASVRGVIGAPIAPTVLLYATGGGAAGYIKASDNTAGGGESKWHGGWTAGGGVEARVSPNLSVRIEYLHYDLHSETHQFDSFPGDQGDIKAHIDVGRAAFNYRF